MPKYLISASATEGVKGVMKDGGTKRRQAAEAAVTSTGGKLEGFYFAFGEHDAYAIVDAPDNASVAASTLAIAARPGQGHDRRAADTGGNRSGD